MKTDTKRNYFKSYRLLILFFSMAASIIILGVLYFRNYEKKYRLEVENQLTAIAELKTGEIIQWRKERLGDGNIFFKNKVFTDYVKSYFNNQNDLVVKQKIQIWMGQIQKSRNYNGVFLLDTLFTKRLMIPEIIERDKAFVSPNSIDSLKSGKIVFEDFYRQESTQKIFLKVLVPILDEMNNNQLIAIIQLRIDPQDYLYPLITKWPTLAKSTETTISRREGNDAVYLNELKFKKNTALNLRIPLEKKEVLVVKVVLGETGIVEGLDYRGVEVIADIRHLPDTPWYLVSKMDKSDLYKPIREKQVTLIVLVIIFLFGLGGVIGLNWKQTRTSDFKEKSKVSDELIIANKELAFQNGEKEKRAAELIIANKELAFQNEEKEKRAAELIIANKELAFQNEEKEKRAAELILANKELLFQNEEKEKRAAELIIANNELAFQNEEKEKRAAELILANEELLFQNEEKEKRAAELIIANKELAFQNEEKEKRAAELLIANNELLFQNGEKEKRAAELLIANKELLFQNGEKEKRAAELLIANNELLFQNGEKEKRAGELIIANTDLSNVLKEVKETVNILVSTSSQILAATTQVASGTATTATSINQTSTTVEEVQQAAKQSAQKAKNVAENAQMVANVSQNGQKAVDETVNGMNRIREQMDSIAQTVIRLSEQSQSIGGIIASVTNIADQSNLLAVNAAIEAAKAGEQGRGFAVVAQEIKNLAGQSKQATSQVRNILNDIQKATGAAVIATEQGSKAVEAGVKQSAQAGDAIRILTESSAEAVKASTQIVASSQQQVIGMEQIGAAMQNINQAGRDIAVSMVQSEKSAKNLNDLGQKLKMMVERFSV
jgi:methyl-accepting chemotaxis protein